jgi:hypothetical protein
MSTAIAAEIFRRICDPQPETQNHEPRVKAIEEVENMF